MLAKQATKLRSLMASAEPASDPQLAFTRAFAGVALSPEHLDLLATLLDGRATADGLTVDADLRWAFLLRLVSRGAAAPDGIDAELKRDPTDAGERHAAACRAATPDPAAKERAWCAIASGQLPNATFRATLNGFQYPDQEDLLRPYAQRYFDVLGDIWRDWGTDMAQHFATYAFPVQVISPETIALADEYLDRPDLPPGLRRLVSEGRDDMARALRCQQADAAGGSDAAGG
jgi:aminopeptidase N